MDFRLTETGVFLADAEDVAGRDLNDFFVMRVIFGIATIGAREEKGMI